MATPQTASAQSRGPALKSPPSPATPALPGPDLNLVLAAPITTWDEAVPLGNGLLGGLLWGEGNVVRLSLDRGDLWDERPAPGFRAADFNYRTMQRLVAERNQHEFSAIFDSNWVGLHPTKIPAGRLELVFDPAQQLTAFELNLATAEGHARFAGGGQLEAFFSAAQPVALLRVSGLRPPECRLTPPASLSQLGYALAALGAADETQWFLQPAAGGLSYCVCVGLRHTARATLLAATVTSSEEGPDPVQRARDRVTAALTAGYEPMRHPHVAWWHEFWRKSAVAVPDAPTLRHYYLVRYFHGAASRRGAPPMPLQGVWTADEGSLPPWKGDYHNDLNTQMTYAGYLAAGHFDEGACYLDFLWNLLPAFRKFAAEFYDAPGAAVPGVMTRAGQALGGWGQYSLSPSMGAWSGYLFYQHWLYTGDRDFLRDRAHPWCREVGQCIRFLLKPDADGGLKLALSTSPEIHDDTIDAWLTPNTNYDHFCLRAFFLALQEMAAAADHPAEAAEWAAVAARLGSPHLSANRGLMLDAKQALAVSHRHLSNLMGMHPFTLITAEGGPEDRRVIEASLQDWDRLGTSQWVGFSFSWMACLRARVGQAEAAVRYLDLFTRAFILRNGFHANGDQTRSGICDWVYRPFTLEGNVLAMQAVHEMLLQSWSPRPGRGEPGIIRLFPAMPWRWHEAAFDDLRTEGGHRVSARRENNATVWFRLVAGRDGVVTIRDNFAGATPTWNRGGVKRVGHDYTVALRQGESIEATLPKPATFPAAPADAAPPLVIHSPMVLPAKDPDAPQPFGVLPSARQLRWHRHETYGFVHFSINTFTDMEWGYGDEPPDRFAPTDCSADQIVQAFKDAGLKGLILTAKHHDGFCLWPSRFTDHSIRHSPYKNGRGDLVREFSDACRRHALAFGIYLSPWDRNRADYAHPSYVTYYRNQLRELLTNYGPIFEVWFDGANGGDGYYGGAREKRKIAEDYYDWEKTYQIVRELQPDAVIFSGVGPDVRWSGNEDGTTGSPCWPTITGDAEAIARADYAALGTGTRRGAYWRPAEADVSIRPGWFYHAAEDSQVKTVDQLTEIYLASVGRGAALILNLPPDRRGRIHETDVKVLAAWGARLRQAFARNLAHGATITASNTRSPSARFAALHLLDGDPASYWATDDGVVTANLVFDLGRSVDFNVVQLREFLPLGCRVDEFALDVWQDGAWREFARGTAIGNNVLVRSTLLSASKVRLRITQAAVCPALSAFGLFLLPPG